MMASTKMDVTVYVKDAIAVAAVLEAVVAVLAAREVGSALQLTIALDHLAWTMQNLDDACQS